MTQTPTRRVPTLAESITVLLVFGAKIKRARDGQPGIRVTAGYGDGSVLLEAAGFAPAWSGAAWSALDEAVQACKDAGLVVQLPPYGMSNHPARVIRKKD